jgi:Domain of unknown function (DUF4209)
MFAEPVRAAGGRRAIFASGLLAFLHGDMISALHTLVPQLENSLRHVLRQHGHDVTRLTEDMNQEDLSLSALLEKLRHALIAIFGDRMVTDIDSVFNYRGGPNLRNRVAHGLVGQWEPQSDDAIYACWLIFQLCCIPLRGQWDELARLFSFAEGPGELEARNMSKVLRRPLLRLTVTRPGRIGPLPLGRRTTRLGAPRGARPAGTSQLVLSSVIKEGEYRVKELKSLAAALKEIEPFVRDPRLLRTGRELRNFGRMKPRELVGNVLLAVAANPATAMEWIRIATDPFNADGLIINEATHEAWLMEHVFAYVHDGSAVDVTNLLLERIAKKVGTGDGYCQGKTLCVLLDHTGQWVPDDIVKKLSVPRTLNSIMVANRTGRTVLGEFVYHIVRLDWMMGYAPRWRVTIASDFTSWRVDREQ